MNIEELQEQLKAKDVEISELQKSGDTSDEIVKSLNVEKDKIQTKLNEAVQALEKAAKESEMLKKGATQMSNVYLKSKESISDLADVLIKSKGEDFTKAWTDHLVTKGIEGAEVFFPEAVVSAVQSNLQEEGRLLPFVRTLSGVSVYTIVNEELNTIGSGHNRAKQPKKKDTKFKFVKEMINSQFIYVFKEIDKELLKEDRKGLLIDYILNSLPKKLVVTIEKAILVGDGLEDDDQYKIHSYEPIIEASEYFKTDITMGASGLQPELLDSLEKAIKSGEYVLVMNRKTFVDLKTLRNSDKAKVFAVGTRVFEERTYPTLDGTMIVENEFLSNDYAGSDAVIIALKIKAYTHITDSPKFDFYRDFTLSTNKEEILVESYSGGALEGHLSAAVVWGKAKA